MVEVLRRIRTGQQWYQAESEIYGDFATRADNAMRLINRPRRNVGRNQLSGRYFLGGVRKD